MCSAISAGATSSLCISAATTNFFHASCCVWWLRRKGITLEIVIILGIANHFGRGSWRKCCRKLWIFRRPHAANQIRVRSVQIYSPPGVPFWTIPPIQKNGASFPNFRWILNTFLRSTSSRQVRWIQHHQHTFYLLPHVSLFRLHSLDWSLEHWLEPMQNDHSCFYTEIVLIFIIIKFII